jgi:hypothetical protein
MNEMNRLEDILARHARQHPSARRELVDAFKSLRVFVERLSAHLSRQELQDILRDSCTGEPSSPERKEPVKEEKTVLKVS